MARAAGDARVPSVKFIDDGLTDEERAAALAAWFHRFDRRRVVNVTVKAADTLAEARAEGEV